MTVSGFFLGLSLKLNDKMEGLMLLPKRLLFVFLFSLTCINKGIRKKPSLVETARSVLKFYHCVFVILFLFQQTRPPRWSGKEKTLGTVGLLISPKINSPSWTLLLLLNVLSKIVYHARSPVWTTWRVSLSTSLLFQTKLENLLVKSCRRTSTKTLRIFFQARLFITSALW